MSLNLPITTHVWHRWWFIFKIPFRNSWNRERSKIMILWSHLTININHYKGVLLWKLVECVLSNMIPDHQKYINSSSKHISKEALLCTWIMYTTTSICVSMICLDSYKTYFMYSSTSNNTLSFMNTLCQIFLILPNILMDSHTIPLFIPFWLIWQMTHVSNIPWHLNTTSFYRPCSWNIRMDYSIHNYPCTSSSYWRHKLWF